MTPKERQTAALIRRLPPSKSREFLESMMPDRAKAVERFRRYAARAEKELMAWELNWMSERISNRLGESFVVRDEVKAEEEERKRQKTRLEVVQRKRSQSL